MKTWRHRLTPLLRSDAVEHSISANRDPIWDLLSDRPDNRITYSVKEVAEMTGMSTRTILRRIADGSLPAIHSNGRTLIPKKSRIG